MTKTIEFRISPDGSEVKIEGKGFKGNECLSNAVTKGVKKALGNETLEEKKKPEYYNTVVTGQTIKG
jgi:hypothetical protein